MLQNNYKYYFIKIDKMLICHVSYYFHIPFYNIIHISLQTLRLFVTISCCKQSFKYLEICQYLQIKHNKYKGKCNYGKEHRLFEYQCEIMGD